MGGPLAKKGKKSSSATEWTLMEQALAVIIMILVVVAVYAFIVNEEVVEVAAIETYQGAVDLRGGEEDNSSYHFDRQLKEDYQVHVKYRVPYAGLQTQPIIHFKVWNESTGKQLFKETTQATYDKTIRLDAEDAGHYQFIWWVDAESGFSRVDYDVLIEPTEKLFEKKT
jgi:hypothetical protein